MAQQQPANRPADVAAQDSVGGMARRLLNPAHLGDLARRSVATLREEGAQQLWRDVTFRVGLAFHHDSWRHRADLPLRRDLKAQRAADPEGPVISIVVPVFNTPEKYFKEMINSVWKQTYRRWQLVLVDASDPDHGEIGRKAQEAARTDPRIVYQKIDNGGIAANTTQGFALANGQYMTLLDHADVMYPNELFEAAIPSSRNWPRTTCADATISPIWQCFRRTFWRRRGDGKALNLTARRTTTSSSG